MVAAEPEGESAVQSPTVLSDAAVADPVLPPAPLGGLLAGAQVTISGDMDLSQLSHLLPLHLTDETAGGLRIDAADGFSLEVTGSGFSYFAGVLVGGVVSGVHLAEVVDGQTVFQLDVTGLNLNAGALESSLLHDALSGTVSTLLANSASIVGSAGDDVVNGAASNDLIIGAGGADTLMGGAGSDVIYATAASGGASSLAHTYLRGEDGDDYVIGGQGFDDINGNAGADTASGGDGADWVVGGRDNDLLFGDRGADIVYGNLGNDTLDGGADADIVRGGQGDDLVFGGAGDDFVSGDLGNDTLVGGAGADVFHAFAGSGADRVLDFDATQGDRVELDAGTAYTVAESGADTVIDLGGGSEMVLVGVRLDSLPAGWIFTA